MVRAFRAEFEELCGLRDAHGRGRAFEALLRRVLEHEGLEVQPNPGAARPRQTDLLVRVGISDVIIEAKWTSRPVNIETVAGLRDRLRRTPADFVGCIFSMSDFTQTAISDAEGNREREILLFNRTEISRICTGIETFADLLEQKRRRLRVHGKAWFWTEAINTSTEPTRHTFVRNGNSADWVTFRTMNQEVIFSRDLLSMHEAGSDGAVSLHLPLRSIDTVDELRWTLREIARAAALKEVGSFSIHQGNCGWHGIGLDQFLSAVERWGDRYREAGLSSYHHSEELAYFGVGEIGTVCLTSRQAVVGRHGLHSSFLELHVPGVPVHNTAIEELCRRTSNEDAYFGRRATTRTFVHLSDRKPLVVEALVVTNSEEHQAMVSGVVAKNPFYQQIPPKPEDELKYSAHQYFAAPEHLICALRDWHPATSRPDFYYLQSLESMWLENIPVLHALCTWNGMPREDFSSDPAARKAFEKVANKIIRGKSVAR